MLKKTKIKIGPAITARLIEVAKIGASVRIIANSYQTNKKVFLITNNSKKILNPKETIKIYNNLPNNDKSLLQRIQSNVLQNFYFIYSWAIIKWSLAYLNVYAKVLEYQNILNLAVNFNDHKSALQQKLELHFVFFIWIYSGWKINWVQHMSMINLFWYE